MSCDVISIITIKQTNTSNKQNKNMHKTNQPVGNKNISLFLLGNLGIVISIDSKDNTTVLISCFSQTNSQIRTNKTNEYKKSNKQ